jgi:hypothetical protein
MTGTEAPTRLLTPELEEMLRLVGDADSVELKLTVPDEDRESAAQALGVDPLNARIRQVFFFDTPDLLLDQAGVVVRARRTQGAPDDTVVKLRPVVPSELPKDVRRSPSFGVELDASPQGFVCSGSMKGVPTAGAVREAVTGKQPFRQLFSKEQRQLFAENAPEGSALDDLTLLGPVFVLKLKSSPEGFDRRLVTELWTKCEPSEAFQVAAEARAYLSSRGIDLGSDQQTKTRTALDYFSQQLKTAKSSSKKKPAS